MGGGFSKALGKIIGVIIMKRALIVLLIAGSVFFSPSREAYPQSIEEKDLDSLLKQLEQKISEQEKVFDSLKAKQSRIVKQKQGLLALIEQDKKKMKEKEEKAAQQGIKKKQRELARFLKEQKARDLKARRDEEKKGLPAQEKLDEKLLVPEKEDKGKNELEEKERISQEAREFQMKLILEKEKKVLQEKDINYLENLIKRQRELCAAVIQLQIDVTAEEKNLKLLKESREFLLNPK